MKIVWLAVALFFCALVCAADDESKRLCDACHAIVLEALYERVEKAEERVAALEADCRALQVAVEVGNDQELPEGQVMLAGGSACVIL